MSTMPEDIKSILDDIGEKINENIQRSIFKGSRAVIIFPKNSIRADFTTVSLIYMLQA